MKKYTSTIVILFALSFIANAQVINTFPYIQTFDGFSLCVPACPGTCALQDAWVNDNTDPMEVFVGTGSTPSVGTGPSGDYPSGTGNYLYVEGDCGSSFQDALVEMPWIEMPGQDTGLVMEFYYHQYGSIGGIGLWSQVDSNKSWLPTTNAWDNSVNQWQQAIVPLTDFTGVDSLQLRFDFFKWFSNADQAIDNVIIHPVYPNDAGIDTVITNPTSCGVSQNIDVVLRNVGIKNLTTATLNWTLGGVLQTPVNWSGSLQNDSSEQVFLANQVITGNQNIQVWVSNPNGVAETYYVNRGSLKLGLGNDTAIFDVFAGISGTFDIGGSTPDFFNITSAVNSLDNGICGPVIFNIEDSTFVGDISLSNVSNASETNTITFQSMSGDSSFIHIYFEDNSITFDVTSLYVIRFEEGASHYRFSKLGFATREGPLLSGARGDRITYFVGKNKDIAFDHCYFQTDTTRVTIFASDYTTMHFFNPPSFPIKTPSIGNISFTNNYFVVGGSSMLIGNFDSLFVFENNKIKDYSQPIASTNKGLQLRMYNGMASIKNNIFIDTNLLTQIEVLGAGDGGSVIVEIRENQLLNGDIILRDFDFSFTGNSLIEKNTSKSLTISNSNSVSIYNNMILGRVSLYGSNELSLLNNSIAGGLGIGGSNIQLFNNSIANNKNGAAFNMVLGSVVKSDYNNFYKTDTTKKLLEYNYSTSLSTIIDFDSISNWYSATGLDKNSINVDPEYFSKWDLHTCNAALESKGNFLTAISDDIDGDLRSASVGYDIGADEFVASTSGEIAGGDKCPGDTAVLSIGNIAGTYLWSTGATTSSIKVTNEGDYWMIYSGICGTLKDTVTVTEQNPNPDFSIAINDLSVVLFNKTTYPGSTYLWDLGDGTTSTEKDVLHNYILNGTYQVSLTVTNACGVFTKTDSVTLYGVFVDELGQAGPNVVLYPNPARGNFKVLIDGGVSREPITVKIYDMQGKLILQEKSILQQGKNTIAYNLDKSGLYMVTVEGEGWIRSHKVIITQ